MPKQGSRYVALLRGINVGGKNIIAKDDLKACFEKLGFRSVQTYIQSGNILFRTDAGGIKQLTKQVEEGLSKQFNYDAQAVVMAHSRYRTAVQSAPASWGHDADHKHNAMFTMSGVSAQKVLSQLPDPKEEIETVTAGPGVIFWSASKSRLTRTTLMQLAKHPVYKQMTVRNHNTTFKLLELLDAM